MKNKDKRIQKWIRKTQVILDYEKIAEDFLNEWEIEFASSIQDRLSKGIELTWKQSKKLNEIWERVE